MNMRLLRSKVGINILLIRPTGSIFSVEKQEVPVGTKVGDIVTFSYGYFSCGKPVEPKVYKVRSDLEWVDVLFSYYSVDQPHINGACFFSG